MQVVKLVIDNAALERYEASYFENHPRAVKKPIAHPYHESINQWMIMKRPMMNALKQRWKDFMIFLVSESEYRDVHIEECEITVTTYYATNRRHDVDNSTPKFLLDGICESGLIVDDDCEHITSLTLKCAVDVDNPRTEIEISVKKLLTDYKPKEKKEDKPMAKKKGKQVSISALENIVKQADLNIVDVEWNGLPVAITRTISLEEMMKFADNVHKSCFNVDTGAYMPEVKEFAIRSNIMQRYANFSLPDNMERQYMIVMTSGAVEMILEHINLVQYHALMDAIDKKLANTADANISALTARLDTIAQSFEKIQSAMEGMCSGIDAGDVNKLIEFVSNGGNIDASIANYYNRALKDKTEGDS